jgi:SAM-dependent methyltransferase
MMAQERSCPHCGSSASATLLSLTCGDILQSNWSYRSAVASDLRLDSREAFFIVECNSCAFIYARLLPDNVFLHTVYDVLIDHDAARAANLCASNLADKMDYLTTLLRLIDGKSPARMLDYGCGFGPALQLLKAIPSIEAIGYETSVARIEDLRQRGLHASTDLDELAMRGPFSAVILDNVLEHLPAPRTALSFISDNLEPEGLLFVSVPDVDRARILAQQAAIGNGGKVAMDVNPWEHLNYFDLRHLDELLAQFLFEPIEAYRLPKTVDIGLRPNASRNGRMKNALASLPRLLTYAARGDAGRSVTRRFYRLKGAA